MRNASLLLAAILALAGVAGANELPDMPKPKVETDAVVAVKTTKLVEPRPTTTNYNDDHTFLDRTNKIEFAVGAGFAAWDTAATCKNFSTGGKEYDAPVSSCGQMAAWTFGLQGGAWLTSFLLHKTHHHKLERIPELYLIGMNAKGAIYSTAHR
jgi:hypothetical protein